MLLLHFCSFCFIYSTPYTKSQELLMGSASSAMYVSLMWGKKERDENESAKGLCVRVGGLLVGVASRWGVKSPLLFVTVTSVLGCQWRQPACGSKGLWGHLIACICKAGT